jgi:hypothetical protein
MNTPTTKIKPNSIHSHLRPDPEAELLHHPAKRQSWP